jgi:hypothetical protein
MKLFTGSLAAGLVLLAAGAQAQAPYGNGRSPYAAVSDFDTPYAAAPVEIPPEMPPQIPGPGYGYEPSLLPSTEVYTVLRENGFSPLGIPRLRGFVYTIAVTDRGGEDGRLIIDARNGRIIRFIPADRMGGRFGEEPTVIYGSPAAPPPPAYAAGSASPPRPSAKVASRTVPVPKAKPLAAKPAPARVQQAAAPLSKPAEVQAAAPQPVTTGSVPETPAPQIAPTQEMPNVQGLE